MEVKIYFLTAITPSHSSVASTKVHIQSFSEEEDILGSVSDICLLNGI